MQKNKIVMACMVMATSTTLWATPVADIYQHRCANCHGDQANGVSKLTKKQVNMKVEEMAGSGIASGPNTNTNGVPLNHLSQEELLEKLQNLRKTEDGISTQHSVMRENLKTIEKREGKMSDEEMAEYIYTTFGPGSKK